MVSLCETCTQGLDCPNSTENCDSEEYYDGSIISECPQYRRYTNATPYSDKEDFGADNVTAHYPEDWDQQE